MKLAELIRPGALRQLATATPATLATETTTAPATVAKVATVAVADTPATITEACRLAGVCEDKLPADLRRDLMTMDGNAEYLAHVIREEAAWHGWNGGPALIDYAPGGRYCTEVW